MPWADFDTTNDRQTSQGPGVCMAMTCHWIRRVFDSRDHSDVIQGLNSAEQLREFRHHVFNQSKFEQLSGSDADRFIFSAYRLRAYRSQHRATIKTLVASIRETGSGLYLFGALGSGGGHAMGIAYASKSAWIFFDPNEGQRCFTSEEAFTKYLHAAMADYSDLKETFELYRVLPLLQGG